MPIDPVFVNQYAVLSVSETTTSHEMQAAFDRKTQAFKRNEMPNDPRAKAMRAANLRRLQNARDVLLDPA